nr:uncharacterized protein LOC117278440 [Nicotiana tomentosiformis]
MERLTTLQEMVAQEVLFEILMVNRFLATQNHSTSPMSSKRNYLLSFMDYKLLLLAICFLSPWKPTLRLMLREHESPTVQHTFREGDGVADALARFGKEMGWALGQFRIEYENSVLDIRFSD